MHAPRSSPTTSSSSSTASTRCTPSSWACSSTRASRSSTPKGEAFNPLEHQAVGRVEDTEAYDETVHDVYQKGYRMGDRILRSAMVTVTYGGAKRPAPEEPAEESSEGTEE